jgi:uncharacterized membrane protein YphA (DoxX/SURF4 family)
VSGDVVAALSAAALAIQMAAGLLFVRAGVQKLRHWQEFRGIVASYQLLPAVLVPAVAVVTPALEVLFGSGAVVHLAMPYAAVAIAAMLMAFAAAAVNIRRGRTQIHCGCFRTALRQELRWRLVVRNLVYAFVLSWSSTLPTAPATLAVALLAIPAGVALVCLYAAADGVWALDASRRTAFGRS